MRGRITAKASNSKITTITLVQIALMAALTYIATSVIAIPVGDNAVLHLGDTLVYLCAILLGRRKGTLAAALGMTFFDMFSPFYIWAPFTFIIKASMAYVAAIIAYRGKYNGDSMINNLVAFITAGVVMIAGYFIAGGLLNHFAYGIPTLGQGLIVALKDIPANIFQVVGGTAIALPLSIPLKKHLGKYIE